jgi:hypothetical protein
MCFKRGTLSIVLLILIPLLITACGGEITTEEPPAPLSTATPTPTPVPGGGGLPSPTPSQPSPCQGLGGQLEMRVLAGPAEAVGMEPFAVGSVPFQVASDASPYSIQGGSSIAYDEVLVRDWGTYEVSMDLDVTVAGTCEEAAEQAQLALQMTITGDQMVIVTAEGFQGEYPWSGSHTIQARLPAEEGATVTGEGWEFVLHLNR